MIIDPIVEEIHRRRQEYMERFHYDLDAIVRDIRTKEAANSGPLLAPPVSSALPTAAQRRHFSRC